jgi:hypothetical protein
VFRLYHSRYALSPLGAEVAVRRSADGACCLVTVELSADAAEVLPDPDDTDDIYRVWPAFAEDDGRPVWHGDVEVAEDAGGGMFGGTQVAWWPTASGVVLAALSDDHDPETALADLASTPLLDGPVDTSGDDHHARWLHAVISDYAPEADPPDTAGLDELRSGLAHLLGYPDVDDLAADAGYRPVPHVGPAGVEFHRPAPAGQDEVLPGQVTFRVPAGDVAAECSLGGLLSPLRHLHVAGLLPDELDLALFDAGAGGHLAAEGVVDPSLERVEAGFVWDDVSVWSRRLGAATLDRPVFLPSDDDGIGPVDFDVEFDPAMRVRYLPAPTVVVPGGVNLDGPFAPNRIVVASNDDAPGVLDALADAGITTLRGRPVADAVGVDPAYARLVGDV